MNMTDQSQKMLFRVGLEAFFNIAKAWGLNAEQEAILLGGPAPPTFSSWKTDPTSCEFNKETLERLSYILGIYKALRILLPEQAAADGWVKQANSAEIFGGQSALDRMLSGNVSDLSVVRRYLDAMHEGV